jgi:alkylated DNA nucleotide flippase Atl1
MADNGVNITLEAIYQELQEIKHGQIETNGKLAVLDTIPERLRVVELELASLAWLKTVAYAGLTASITALVAQLIGAFSK